MSCNCLLVRIDPNDITSSTGNTLYSDNTVFIDGFTDCELIPISSEFTERGYYCYCMADSSGCSLCEGEGWVIYDDTQCYRELTTTATPPSGPLAVVNVTEGFYSEFGTRFYNIGFNVNGTGTYAATSTLVPLWDSGSISPQGPLNRCGIWTVAGTPAPPFDTWIGFSVCLNGIVETKTYYVGVAGDNNFRITLDGNTIVNTLGGPYDGASSAFKNWHIYPVAIGAGDHTLEVWGLNNGSYGSFGCEIYDNTLSELTNATDVSELNIIFTSNDQSEFTVVQDTSGTYLSSGYTCPSGYVYSTCDGFCIAYEYCEITAPSPNLFYYQDDVLISGETVLSYYLVQDTTCSTSEDCCTDICTTSSYCISNTGNPAYDDNYDESGLHNGKPYWIGSTNGLFIYYSIEDSQWCLSSSLDGVCLLSGKSPCPSTCPDLNGAYFNTGMCLTPTPTPTNNCDILNFESFFDCEVIPTPTPTPTPTQTPTMTPTPSSTNYCSIVEVVATINSYSPTPTPTPTVTPSSSGIIDRPCHFYGDATFNTVDEMINCPISKQFQDCFNGTMYYTTNNVTNPSGGNITEFMVFNALVDGLTKCISYVGTTTQISGVNNIILNSGPYGYSNLNGCSSCIPSPTSTPTPTPSITPTNTSTPTPTPESIG